MTESPSEQDEANPVFWLAPWAGKVGPYYCACESLIKRSCRERLKQLLHFENKINVVTKFKIFTRFHKNIVMGCQVRGCQTLKTSVVVVWPQLREIAFRHGSSEMHLYCSIHFRVNTGKSCISFSSAVSHPSCACCSSLYDLLFCWSWKSEGSGSCPPMKTKRFC